MLAFARYHFLCLSVIIFYLLPVMVKAENKAEILWQKGEFQQSIQYWQHQLTQTKVDDELVIDIHIKLAQAYQHLGLVEPAKKQLKQALALAEESPEYLAIIYAYLSDINLVTQQELTARQYIDKSISLLPQQAADKTQVLVLNQLGNVLHVEAYYEAALTQYQRALQVAVQQRMMMKKIRIMLNIARTYFNAKDYQQAVKQIEQILHTSPPKKITYNSAFHLISTAELAQRVYQKYPEKNLIHLAHSALSQAEKYANHINSNYLLSYIYGYLGRLYELDQQVTQAITLTRRAIFLAQQQQSLENLYHWQWQLGRLFKQQQQATEAINSYRNAVTNLQPIRHELTIGYRNRLSSFRDTIGMIYFELADLLLSQARTSHDLAVRQTYLLDAYATIERLKTAELQDYFQDSCLAQSPQKPLQLIHKRSHTAIIYPIVLPERIEILLGLPDGIQQIQIPISALTLKDEVNEFRFELETRDNNAYLQYAQRLYQWLIAPLNPILKKAEIKTLVFVPDGVLRTIPLAALHDGKQFLIEDYAIATLPSLTLTSSTTAATTPAHILINGLSDAVQGYSALAGVKTEVNQLTKLYADHHHLLFNESFTEAAFAAALQDTSYTMIHVASHGQFSSHAGDTFLLTHDGKLTMNRLERLLQLNRVRTTPLDLLTLSACQTAVGDDQAALGLAGIAVKAGVRTALASLWFIDDTASAQLISEFYRQLKEQKRTKAEALRQAQRALLQQKKYHHPAFWAPFLLIGHWY